MNFLDMTYMGFSNLWRTRLRSTLTVLGVVIGIGALTSMVSFGTGMQKNITDAFTKNDLFTSMNVTPENLNLDEIMSGNLSGIGEIFDIEPQPLTDSILQAIREIEGVQIAFPDESFAGRLRYNERETSKSIQPIPEAVSGFYPYNDLLAGKFYSDDSSKTVVIRWEVLRDLGLVVDFPEIDYSRYGEDTVKGIQIVTPDSVIGRQITLVTAAINIPSNPLGIILDKEFQPFQEITGDYVICGILKPRDEFSFSLNRGDLFIPPLTARDIPRLGFSSVWDILGADNKEGTYSSIYVRVAEMEDLTSIREKIEAMGVGVFTLADQLEEIKRVFLIMDGLLGAIGTVALIIAALGIINTMLMSILERTREIGIMKAVGGSENEIKFIFFVEAACIGLVGALFGLVLGWLVTIIANHVMNTSFMPPEQAPIDLFYFPLWLILGAIAFSVIVSLAAGMYPAIRASRIDPVRALRHD